MKETRYRMPIATNGVMSNIPSLGITLLNGDKIGSVTSASRIISRLERLITNHDRIARMKIAMVRILQKKYTKLKNHAIPIT